LPIEPIAEKKFCYIFTNMAEIYSFGYYFALSFKNPAVLSNSPSNSSKKYSLKEYLTVLFWITKELSVVIYL
jgi:hypothetical protein